ARSRRTSPWRRSRSTRSTPSGPIPGRYSANPSVEVAMAALTEVKVPDIGDFKDVPIIEVMVKPGGRVKAEDSLITLESDKATMAVPAPLAGVVKDIKVKIGDKVSEGAVIVTLTTGTATGDPVVAAAMVAAPTRPAPTAAPAARAQPPAQAGAIDEA